MSNIRVLLVDDEPSLRMTLAANLELEGFEVVEAGTGMEALALLEQQSVDLILSDIRMPGMSGVELFRQVRAQKRELPFILMSAFAVEDLIESALQEGAFTLLPKPFDISHAVRTLERAARIPRVLIVDDTQADADSLALTLESLGIRARAVYSGEQTMAALASGDVDVCVVDLVMPEMTGPEVVRQVRAHDPRISVIAMSGYAVPELVQKAAAFDVYTCMRKPFDVSELAVAIARARGVAPTSERRRARAG